MVSLDFVDAVLSLLTILYADLSAGYHHVQNTLNKVSRPARWSATFREYK